MNYPASHLTPFLPAHPVNAPFASGHQSLVPHTAKLLNTHGSIACSLLKSLGSLFAHAFLCFQSFADSFCKIGGVGYPPPQPSRILDPWSPGGLRIPKAFSVLSVPPWQIPPAVSRAIVSHNA